MVVCFTGPDVYSFQATALRSGLGLMAAGIKPHRTWVSLQAALNEATGYTGKYYDGRRDIERARRDLQLYINAKKQQQP